MGGHLGLSARQFVHMGFGGRSGPHPGLSVASAEVSGQPELESADNYGAISRMATVNPAAARGATGSVLTCRGQQRFAGEMPVGRMLTLSARARLRTNLRIDRFRYLT